jgi:hypothetical protein
MIRAKLRDEHAPVERNRSRFEASKHKSQFMANVTHGRPDSWHFAADDLVMAGIPPPVSEKQLTRSRRSLKRLSSGWIDDSLQPARLTRARSRVHRLGPDLELLPFWWWPKRPVHARDERAAADRAAGAEERLPPVFTDRGSSRRSHRTRRPTRLKIHA